MFSQLKLFTTITVLLSITSVIFGQDQGPKADLGKKPTTPPDISHTCTLKFVGDTNANGAGLMCQDRTKSRICKACTASWATVKGVVTSVYSYEQDPKDPNAFSCEPTHVEYDSKGAGKDVRDPKKSFAKSSMTLATCTGCT